jgi:LuxR family transcriptional regulator, maltose regulon positive regulatory protein
MGPELLADVAAGAGDSSRVAPIIATKLGPPPAASSYRDRARLSEHLDRSLADTTRLTLVSAPPGYGKSVAASGWLASRAVPHAWLSLDAGDNDPSRFLRYLVATLESVRPGIRKALTGLLGQGASTGLDVAGAELVDAIAASDDPFVLALDDYHVITSVAVHGLVRFLIERGPPFAHLLIISREDPPLPLARLRAHRRLVELRADELRFTRDEVAAYLVELSGLDLDGVHLARLVDRTEGWIAGVQLAAISMQGRSDAGAVVDTFAGTQRFVLDYLAAEVLDALEPDLREFLVRISVAGRFTVALCRELSGSDDSAALLERAERMNLFLIPLDLERRWYRFHHLFADYLRTNLDEGETPALHERASDYFEREGFTSEAIEHALAAGSADRAIRLVERAARPTYEAGELSTLLGWINGLPSDRVAASPELIAMQGYAAFQTGRVREAARACEVGEAAAPCGTTSGPLLSVCALIAAFSNRPDAIAFGRASLEVIGDDTFFHARALHALATSYLSAGDLPSVIETARAALDLEAGSERSSSLTVPAVTALVTALNLTGHRREAESICRETMAIHRTEAIRMGGGTPYALYWLGTVLYEANELDEAVDALERAWAAAGTFGFGRAMLTTAVAYLALARQASGSPDAALDAVHTVLRDTRAAGLEGVEGVLRDIEARLFLVQDNLIAAARWADEFDRRAAPADAAGPAWPDLAGTITAARIRLAQGSFDDAARLLGRARATAGAVQDVADLISIGILEGVLAERTGDRLGARSALEAALRQAAPEGYVRRMIDDGRPLAHLLPAARTIAPTFVDAVTTALAEPAATAPAEAHVRRSGPSLRQDADGRLIEALTARELEVLRLMARGCGDAAIADALVVSLATAKWHAAHIRAKLDARSRTQALLRAQELGLV